MRLPHAAEARRVLDEVYGRFSEGFETPDLIETKALLDTPIDPHIAPLPSGRRGPLATAVCL
jgi:hypothetical protein